MFTSTPTYYIISTAIIIAQMTSYKLTYRMTMNVSVINVPCNINTYFTILSSAIAAVTAFRLIPQVIFLFLFCTFCQNKVYQDGWYIYYGIASYMCQKMILHLSTDRMFIEARCN